MKFTSEILRQAWALAKQAAGSASARPFLGWAMKEVRSMTETKTPDLSLFTSRFQRVVRSRQSMDGISLAEALRQELEIFLAVGATVEELLAQGEAERNAPPSRPVPFRNPHRAELDGTFPADYVRPVRK